MIDLTISINQGKMWLMGNLIEKVTEFFQNEDIVDFLYTFLKERPELLVIIVAIVFIFVLSLWTMMERLQKRGAIALVPIYRFAVLFSSMGLNPWLSVLMIVPGINVVMRIVFYVRVAKTFNRSYVMVPFLILLPLVFLPIVAFGDGKCSHVRLQKVKEMPPKEEEVKIELRPEPSGWQSVDKPKPIQKKEGFSITVEGGDEIEEVHVLTMAELKRKRLQVKETKSRRIIVNDVSTPEEKHVEPTKPVVAKPIEPKPVIITKRPLNSDMMPSMRQGPKGVDIARQKVKAEENKGGEYERLLRQQQNAQMRREGLVRGGVRRPTIDAVARRKPVNKVQKKPNGKIEIKISG